MTTEEGGFLSRWSRRKALVREGREAVDPVPAAPAAPVVPAAPVGHAAPVASAAAVSPAVGDQTEPATEPPPTLEDVSRLTPASDFTRFVARDVDPTVKNAALKTLFTDPHFNVMDGLDIYIDDYGKPDPLPEGMLRQMVQSQFLGLFADEETDKEKQAEAQADAPVPTEPQDIPSNEDADLRLQSHDAADAAEPGPGEPGAGKDAAGQH
jgi:Protein of unknown function (DUF3306)